MGVTELAGFLLSCDFGGEAVQVVAARSEEDALRQAGYVRYQADAAGRYLALGDEERSGYVNVAEEPGFAHLAGKVACPSHALAVVRTVNETRAHETRAQSAQDSGEQP